MGKFGKLIYQPMTEANFIALAQKRYAALQALNKIDNFYDYEKDPSRALKMVLYFNFNN